MNGDDRLHLILHGAIVILAILAACGAPPDSDSAGSGARPTGGRARGLAGRQLSIVGLRQGSSEDAVLDALGRPDVASPARYDGSLGDSVSMWTYDGVLVKVAGHRVVNIHCSAKRCVTADGVRVDDPRSHVLNAYGPPRSVETMDAEVLKYAGAVDECTLSFTIREELISAIDLACDGS